jgi:hypothetical protein
MPATYGFIAELAKLATLHATSVIVSDIPYDKSGSGSYVELERNGLMMIGSSAHGGGKRTVYLRYRTCWASFTPRQGSRMRLTLFSLGDMVSKTLI